MPVKSRISSFFFEKSIENIKNANPRMKIFIFQFQSKRNYEKYI